MRRAVSRSEWVFAAPTNSGHIEQSSLKKQHNKACQVAGLKHFPFYTFRHTCLTRWAALWTPILSPTSQGTATLGPHEDTFTRIWIVDEQLWNGHEVRRRGTILGTKAKGLKID